MPKRVAPALILACLSACSLFAPKYQRPVVTVAKIQLQGGNLMRQNFRVTLHAQNPNDRALPVTAVHADLKVAGEAVASGVTDRAFIVPAHGETDFDMTITANMALTLLKLAGQRDLHEDSIDYEVSGAANVDLPLVHELPFHQTGRYSLKGLQ